MGVCVGVDVFVGVLVGVPVWVGVGVLVIVGVGLAVFVGIGVGVGGMPATSIWRMIVREVVKATGMPVKLTSGAAGLKKAVTRTTTRIQVVGMSSG